MRAANAAVQPSAALHRREYKCLIDEPTVERIRRYIRGICEVDPYAVASGGRYLIDTLYLDTPDLATYWATIEDRGDRYKLRVRGYPSAPGAPVFLEVKRRVGDTILKTRGAVQGDWAAVLEPDGPAPAAPGATAAKHRAAIDNFICHYRYAPMLPTALVRYEREPYASLIDEYARVTFDRSISFQAATELSLASPRAHWMYLDHATAQRGLAPAASAVLLELKFTTMTPAWMREMVRALELQRVSFCKYSRAIDALRYPPTLRVARAGIFR